MFGKINATDKFDEAMRIAKSMGWYTVDDHPPFPFAALLLKEPEIKNSSINMLIESGTFQGMPGYFKEGSESIVRHTRTRKYYEAHQSNSDAGPFDGYWFAVPINEVVHGIPQMNTIVVEAPLAGRGICGEVKKLLP